jgi:Zn-dependent protease
MAVNRLVEAERNFGHMLSANRAGSALALTLVVFYSLCSLLFVVWPQGFMAATAIVFHGFELSPTPHALSFGKFILGVLWIAIVGYLVGAVYELARNVLLADRTAVKRRIPPANN